MTWSLQSRTKGDEKPELRVSNRSLVKAQVVGERTNKEDTEEPASDAHPAYPQTEIVKFLHYSCGCDNDERDYESDVDG